MRMARPRRSAPLGVLASALASIACRGGDARDRSNGAKATDVVPPHDARVVDAPIDVPWAHQRIKLDGEWDEPDWDKVAARRVFTSAGAEARPYSEIRFLRDRDDLIVGLYAADEDIHSGEAFELTLGRLALGVDAAGRVSPAIPGVRVAVDRDGTLDRSDDLDEEWVIELEIPLRALGVGVGGASAELTAHARRCDTPKAGGVWCGFWDGSLAFDSR